MAAGRGTYTLLIRLAEPSSVAFGALGGRALAAGWYAYTGSAFGSGGFARVERHRELAAGERTTRHWHVDYLLGHPAARIERVVRSPGRDIECAVSGRLVAVCEPVSGVGASDCGCETHLAYAADRGPLERAIEDAYDGG